MIYDIDKIKNENELPFTLLKCICIKSFLDFEEFIFEEGFEYLYYKVLIKDVDSATKWIDDYNLIGIYDNRIISIGIENFDKHFLDYREEKIKELLDDL